MSEENTKINNTDEILSGFAQLLTQHQEASEKRQEKSDKKLDKLVESVTALNQSHIETRKDREFDTQRMERIESNQKEQGEKIGELAESMILVKERQGTAKNKWDRVANILTTILTVGIIGYLGLK